MNAYQDPFDGLTDDTQDLRMIFAECLAKYAGKRPRKFLQVDAFYLPNGGDDIMRPDADGDCIHYGTTHELMNGPDTARVLIPPQSSPEQAARALRKIADILESDGAGMFDRYVTEKCKHCRGTGKHGDGVPF